MTHTPKKPRQQALRNSQYHNVKRGDSALSKRADRELDSDRKYFREHPDRKHYIRRIFKAEELKFEQMAGSLEPPPGLALFVVVQEVRPGARLRVPFCAPPETSMDLAEEEDCACWFKIACPDWLRETRQTILNAKPEHQ